MTTHNKHTGSSLEDMLREDGIFEETKDRAMNAISKSIDELTLSLANQEQLLNSIISNSRPIRVN